MLQLLVELRDHCSSNGIRFVLANHSAWDAVKFKQFHGDMYETAIMMERDQFEALSRTTLPVNRSIREFDLRGCSAKYVDMRSVLLDYRDNPRAIAPYVGIEITIAERVDDGYAFRKPDGTNGKLPPDSFDELGKGSIDGKRFPLFADVNPYFSEIAGASWKSSNYPYRVPRRELSVVYVADMDHDLFMSQPEVKKSLTAAWRKMRHMYWDWTKSEYTPARKHLDSYDNYFKRTDDRFRLWEQYYPMKRAILALAEDGNAEKELEAVLGDLLDCMWRYKKRGLGFTIDESLLQICIPFLVKRYGQTEVDKFLDMIPEEYRKQDIDELLRERGVNHPLLNLEAR